MNETYSEIIFRTVERFRMARYVIISPNPEDDVNAYMDRWARQSGLLDVPGYTPRKIGWDFPFVTKQQQEQFGLRGYVSAYVIPEDFTPACGGTEVVHQDTDEYAVITVADPFSAPFEKIPGGYHKIFEHITSKQCATCDGGDRVCPVRDYGNRICMEHVYEKDGVVYMEIYVPVDRIKASE